MSRQENDNVPAGEQEPHLERVSRTCTGDGASPNRAAKDAHLSASRARAWRFNQSPSRRDR